MLGERESWMVEHVTRLCYLASHRTARACLPSSDGRGQAGAGAGAWAGARAYYYLWSLVESVTQEEEEGFYISGCGGDTAVRKRYEAPDVAIRRDGPDSWHVVRHDLPACKFAKEDAAWLFSDFRWYGCDSDDEVAQDAVDKVREDLQAAIREGDQFSSRYLETLEYLVAADPKFPEKSAEEER